ncbi:MAG: hypothetical protein V9G29_00185 [Burkholderiaceae bacterium]
MSPPPATLAPPPSPWRWIPTLYFAQGLPYVVVMTLAVVLYKNLGVSNTQIALLHQLAVPALGDQAAVEPGGGPAVHQAALGGGAAVLRRRGAGRRGAGPAAARSSCR